jgi:hypothetical protein
MAEERRHHGGRMTKHQQQKCGEAFHGRYHGSEGIRTTDLLLLVTKVADADTTVTHHRGDAKIRQIILDPKNLGFF